MSTRYDIVCFSHHRWGCLGQRPHHLMARFRRGRVLYVEEPVYVGQGPHKTVTPRGPRVAVLTPQLSMGLARHEEIEVMETILEETLKELRITRFVSWYTSPRAWPFTRRLDPVLRVYDCMEQCYRHPWLADMERELLARVDLVFTSGLTLYEQKKAHHNYVFPFPSSVDVEHFGRARQIDREPADQAVIPRPRVGYFGTIDERLDLDLLGLLASTRPDLHFVLVGPVNRIESGLLPREPNLHYMGVKPYESLPAYLAGWDVAMMPFNVNRTTQFLCPSKTPEYLAGGKPVVSTSLPDVIRPYQELGLVEIADSVAAFSRAIDECRAEDPRLRLLRTDHFLARNSWDATWGKMQLVLDEALATRRELARV